MTPAEDKVQAAATDMAQETSADSTRSTSSEQASSSQANAAVLEEMARAGILLGRSRARTNPRMKKFVFANRNGFEIFDLNQTLEAIEIAKDFLKEAVKKGKPILFVGTTPASQAAVKATAEKLGFPYVVERWLGGTLTNFDTLSKRLQQYMTMKADQAAGRLEKYTKQERTEIAKQIERLTRFFSGLEKLTTLPAAVVAVGADAHEIAIKEAIRAKIPVVSIANTSADPDLLDYCIPANDNSRTSVEWILNKLSEAIETGMREVKAAATAKPESGIKK